MPNIRPFNALIPAAHLQGKVVTRPLENYSSEELKRLCSANDYSFFHLINPELENSALKGDCKKLLFKKINQNLDHFLKQQVLLTQEPPTLFIYRVTHDGLTQTGIWTITAITDYLEGHIKKHENTVERLEKKLAEYLEQTRLDANPVLLTYTPNATIDRLIAAYINTAELLNFELDNKSQHQVWAVTTAADLKQLINAFKEIPVVYIADGHHRIAAMAKLNRQTYFAAVYMNTHEVKVLPYNRMVTDLGELTPSVFLVSIQEYFDLEEQTEAIIPAEMHEIGMYLDQKWYLLRPKKELYNANDPVEVLDVNILHQFILEPILDIKDPRRDVRITFCEGKIPVNQLQQQVDSGTHAVLFTLFAVTVAQIIAVADANGIMPPKSTWIEPKFPVGLITNQLTQ
ncbi:DUF1015 domain-containing protein [Pedobacter sp.]|uniref:DUF1015 domain-containing protein n=1 Tax=Pedobacter sp. TaxID=1411316 RepID=UPI003D7F73B9